MKLSMLLALPVALVWLSPVSAQTFERILSDTLDERPNCIEHTSDGGYIIAGTQKDLPMA